MRIFIIYIYMSLSIAAPTVIDIPPSTHKIRHGDILLSWIRENSPISSNSLRIALSRLGEEYLKASELVLSNPSVSKYLPDSLILLEVLEEGAIFFDRESQAELHLHSWELKIDFLRLALYYALQAKELLAKNLIVLRRHAEAFKCKAMEECADPFEVAAFEKGCKVSRYSEPFKKELALYALFEMSIYKRLLEKERLYEEFLNDLKYHMDNGTILRSSSTHPFKGLISEYSKLLEVWNRRYEALTTAKKYPLPESLAKENKCNEEIEFRKSIYDEIEMLTEQVLTLQAIKTQLEECAKIFSDKLNRISGDNLALKAIGTAGVIEKVISFANNYHDLLYKIHGERLWRLLSLVGTLKRINSTIPIPGGLDSILMNAPHLTLATFNRIIMDLILLKGRAQEIELQALREASLSKIEPKSRSLLSSILFP